MGYTRFNHLNVPDQWRQYWTKYPEGYTILEALLNWVNQVDSMVDNINSWNEYLDQFVLNFDKNLQNTVEEILFAWRESGFLEVIISKVLEDKYKELEENVRANRQLLESLQLSKITRNNGEVTSADLSQEVKEMMTGGSVPVVGDNSILTKNIVDHQVTHKKLEKDYNVNTPWFNSDSDNVDYIWNEGSTMVGSNVLNNPTNSTGILVVERGKTSETSTSLWIKQKITSIDDSTTFIRSMYVDEMSNTITYKRAWREVTNKSIEELLMNTPWLSDDSFDLNRALTIGSFMVASNVKNNPIKDVTSILINEQAKTTENSTSYWVKQTISSLSSPVQTYERIIYISGGIIDYIMEWTKRLNDFDKIESSQVKGIEVVEIVDFNKNQFVLKGGLFSSSGEWVTNSNYDCFKVKAIAGATYTKVGEGSLTIIGFDAEGNMTENLTTTSQFTITKSTTDYFYFPVNHQYIGKELRLLDSNGNPIDYEKNNDVLLNGLYDRNGNWVENLAYDSYLVNVKYGRTYSKNTSGSLTIIGRDSDGNVTEDLTTENNFTIRNRNTTHIYFPVNRNNLASTVLSTGDKQIKYSNEQGLYFDGVILNRWKNKQYVVLGTSMSKIDTSYSWYTAKALNMKIDNRAVSGGGLTTSASAGNTTMQAVKAMEDFKGLLTIEVGPNDSQHPIGQAGDTTEDTFYGCLYTAFNELTKRTTARIVVLTMSNQWADTGTQDRREVVQQWTQFGGKQIEMQKAIKEMAQWFSLPVIDIKGESGLGGYILNTHTSYDWVHPTELGGVMMGQYVVQQLLTRINPFPDSLKLYNQ